MKDIFEKSTNDSKNKELHSSIIELMWHYNLYQRWLMVWECNWFDGGITYKLQKHYIIRVAFFMRKIIVNLFLSLLTLFCQWQECPRLGLEKSQLLQKVLSSFCLVVHWMSISLLQALVTIIVAGACSWQRKTIKRNSIMMVSLLSHQRIFIMQLAMRQTQRGTLNRDACSL